MHSPLGEQIVRGKDKTVEDALPIITIYLFFVKLSKIYVNNCFVRYGLTGAERDPLPK